MKVLAIGRGPEIVDTATKLLRANGFAAVGTIADAEALRVLDTGEITDLIIGGGVEPDSRAALKQKAADQHVTVHEAKRGGRGIEEYLNDVVIPTLERQ
ncbi:hypothetical protein OIE68_34325 [Nocardia vinacea]|uniref:Response regulator n=1 Tax=Nocardia vinacea TaxID=96468 RepID=A0ABZ1Z4E2_9NOCA|nr:hypothetical protein OIE68_34325 [Nocardia vinacea]